MATKTLDHGAILQTGFGFWSSKVLLTAVELEVFTRLGAAQLTGDELGEAVGVHPRGRADFFDALVAMGYLDREGAGPTATYSNPELSATFLDQNSPRYIGGILAMLNARLYKFWDDLPQALRTGEPQNEVKHSQKPLFEELYADLPRLEQFVGAMAGVSRVNFENFVERFDFSGYQTMCDVGGATGLLATLAARRHPHLRCSTFDLPPVQAIAERHIQAEGLSDRVTTLAGDFFRDPLPQADVLTFGMILHDWNLEKKLHLIRSAYEALPENGAMVVIEHLIDDERRHNLFGLLMSLNMLIETGDGFDFTAADFRGWCTEVGFRRFDVLPLDGPASAAVAYK